MVYKRTWIKKIVSDFIQRLNKKGLPVEQVFLFGSYAWGRPTAKSDLDIAVVSSKFKRWNDIKRIEFLSDVSRYIYPDMDIEIDAVGFTQDELEKASYFDLAAQVFQKGKVVYKKAA